MIHLKRLGYGLLVVLFVSAIILSVSALFYGLYLIAVSISLWGFLVANEPAILLIIIFIPVVYKIGAQTMEELGKD